MTVHSSTRPHREPHPVCLWLLKALPPLLVALAAALFVLMLTV